MLYPNEKPDAVSDHHLHFTQLPRQEKIDLINGLSEGFHIIIHFDHGFKNTSRQETHSVYLRRLRQIDIPFGTTYSNLLDIALNAVTK